MTFLLNATMTLLLIYDRRDIRFIFIPGADNLLCCRNSSSRTFFAFFNQDRACGDLELDHCAVPVFPAESIGRASKERALPYSTASRMPRRTV